MPETTNASFGSLISDGRRWWSQLRELLQARYELVALEVRSDIDATKRLGIIGGAGLALALTGLPVLVVVIGQALAVVTVIDAVWWQLALGLFSLLCGVTILWFSWRAFRREFTGLRETLEELREDTTWLKEMAEELAAMHVVAGTNGEREESARE